MKSALEKNKAMNKDKRGQVEGDNPEFKEGVQLEVHREENPEKPKCLSQELTFNIYQD